MLLSEILNYTHKIKKIEISNKNTDSLYQSIITKINLPTNKDEIVRFSLNEKSDFLNHQKKDNDYFLRIPNNLNKITTLYAHFFPKELYQYKEEQQIFSEYDLRQLHHPETDNHYITTIKDEKLYVQSTLNKNGKQIIKDPNYKNFIKTNIQKNISDMTEQGQFPLSSIYRPPYQYINAPNLTEKTPQWIPTTNDNPYWERFIHRTRLSPLISDGVENTGEDTPLNVYFNYQYLPTSTNYHQHRYGFQGSDEHDHPDNKSSYYNVLEGENLNFLHQNFISKDNYRIIPNKNPFDESHTINVPKEKIININLNNNSIIHNNCTLTKNKCKNYYIYKETDIQSNCTIPINLKNKQIYSLIYYIYLPDGTINNNGCYITINNKKISQDFLDYDMSHKNQWIYHEIPFIGEENNIIKIKGPQVNISDNYIYFTDLQIKEFVEYSPIIKYNIKGMYLMDGGKYTYQKPTQNTETSITPSTKEYEIKQKPKEPPLGRIFFVFDNEENIYYNSQDGTLLCDYINEPIVTYQSNGDLKCKLTDQIKINYFGGTPPNYDDKNAGSLMLSLLNQIDLTDGPNNIFSLKVKDTYNNIINTGTVTCDITETNTYNLDSETVIKHIGSRNVINNNIYFDHINLKNTVPIGKDYKIYYLRMIYEDICYDEKIIDYKKIIIHHVEYNMNYNVNNSTDIPLINSLEQLPVNINAIVTDQLGHTVTDGYVELSVDDKVVQDTIIDEDGVADFYLDLEDLKQGKQIIKLEYFDKFYIPNVVKYFSLTVDVNTKPTIPIKIVFLNKHNNNNHYEISNNNILLFYLEFNNINNNYILNILKDGKLEKTINGTKEMNDLYFFDIINEKQTDLINYQFKILENSKYRENTVNVYIHIKYP